MDALEQAFPSLTPAELLAKAHGQLLLEVLKKQIGWTFASWEFEFSPGNVTVFRAAHICYNRRYRRLFRLSAETKRERQGFLHFCGTHGLTIEGRIFMLWFRVKGLVARAIKSVMK
jgi:hypothetical protein